MLKVSNLEYRYPRSQTAALNGINFSVRPGEVIAIVGNNGSGKSTLGRLLAGIIQPKTGEISIDWTNSHNDLESYLKHVGIVFQNPENQIIFSKFRDEVTYMLPDLSEQIIDNRIKSSLRAVDMLDFEDANLHDLSLGQKQRIVIAEMLTKQPDYLILDEPTAMVDSWNKEKIYHVIEKLKSSSHAIICITNLADEILLADRTLILSEGKIVADIPREKLINSAKIFTRHHIKLPLLLDLCAKLNINLQNFNADELIAQLKNQERHV